MSSSSRITSLAAGLLRSRPLMRAPIWLYRARLGALLGSRLLMLEHRGRTSGARRYVVLEVIDHREPGDGPESYVVASGFGKRAQWFRNIQAHSQVRVYIRGTAPAPATARVLGQADADRTMAAYINRNPRAWQRFKPVLENTLGEPISDTHTPVPLVELALGRD